jgi:hypothetical protein
VVVARGLLKQLLLKVYLGAGAVDACDRLSLPLFLLHGLLLKAACA